jgi:hypothetical protein
MLTDPLKTATSRLHIEEAMPDVARYASNGSLLFQVTLLTQVTAGFSGGEDAF